MCNFVAKFENMMNQKISFLFALVLLVFAACKSDQTGAAGSNDDILNSYEGLSEVYTAYKADENQQTASKLVIQIMNQIGQADISEKAKLDLLNTGYQISSKHKLTSRTVSFLYPLIKETKNAPENEERLAKLANIMFDMKEESAGNVLANGFMRSYPSSSYVEGLKKRVTFDGENMDAYIQSLGTKIFEEPDFNGLNRASCTEYIDACQAHALSYPNSASSPSYLYKAAEVAKSIKSTQKALTLYDWILDEYPDFDKAATTLFIKGFIIENELGNDDLARTVYNSFLEKYPKHELADDVEFLIENLGKTDEEIAKLIESKRAAK
jgi:tetratricopeptide (TPR) repeat protein